MKQILSIKHPAAIVGLAKEVSAGIITASVALPLCIAAGVLAYSPFGGERVAEGAIAGIISAIIGGIIASLLRRSSYVTTIPTNPNALIQASLLGGLLTAFNGQTALAIAAFLLCTAMAGLWQIVIGAAGLARIVKLAPYPVIAGFVSGIGILIIFGQVPAFTASLSWDEIVRGHLNTAALSSLIFGLLLVAMMFALQRWAPQIPALLSGLLIGYAGYHVMHALAPGISLGPVVGGVDLSGWSPIDLGGATAVLTSDNFDAWRILLTGSITLALVGTLDTVFSLRAARNTADIKVNENRDLVGQGLANLATSAANGLFVSTSLSLSSTNYQAGGRGRMSTLTVGLALLVGIALFPQLIFSLPRLVLAAILVVVGLNVVDKWALRMCLQALAGRSRTERAQARRNIVVVLTVALATILGQPVVGSAVGVALSCIVFIIEMNRPIIRRRDSVARLRSKRVRSAAQSGVLKVQGREVAVFELQGVLFFGNADDLETEIEKLPEHIGLILLDFRTVRDVDVSGAVALQQIAERLSKHGKRLLLSGLGPLQMRRAGTAVGAGLATFPDIDAALEAAEEEIIGRSRGDAGVTLEVGLDATDIGRGMNADDLRTLASHMRQVGFSKGETLCNAGDASDRLWLLIKGSVSVWIPAPGGRRRVASIGPGCTVGEMGLLNNQVRSAAVCADDEVLAYELTANDLEQIQKETPSVGHAVLTSLARQLAERLRQATEELRVSRA